VANPNGTPENLRPRPPWKPGESGNPNGYSKRRRIADTVAEVIDKKGMSEELALIVLAKATGRKELLTFTDRDGKKVTRDPDIAWFNMLREMVDGPPRRPGEDEAIEAPAAARMTEQAAAKVLRAMADASGQDEGPEGPSE
jgi:hypothetical protein